LKLSGWEVVKWEEQRDYNGCRVLAKKSFKIKDIDSSKYELITLYTYLSNWYKSICDVEEKIIKLEKKRYIIWGAGMHLEFLYQTTSLFKTDKEFIIIDSDKNKHNKSWRGIAIYHPNILNELNENDSIIISSYGSQDKIEKFIKEIKDDIDTIKLYDYLKVY
jgi:FlaA1/EpsC-like NDP-sugar epimerase